MKKSDEEKREDEWKKERKKRKIQGKKLRKRNQKEKREKRKVKLSDLPHVVLFFAAIGLIVGGITFALFYIFFSNKPNTNISDIVTATATLIGALTLGGAAAIQYRKQWFTERQVQADERRVEKDLVERLKNAIVDLDDVKLAVRIATIYELKRLAVNEEEAENINTLLSDFFKSKVEILAKEHAKAREENPELENARPEKDVFIAADVLTYLYTQFECRASLFNLYADHLDLSEIKLQGAKLRKAHLQGVDLSYAMLQGADLSYATVQGADLLDVEVDKKTIMNELLYGKGNEVSIRSRKLSYLTLQCR